VTLRFELLAPAAHDRAAFRCGEPRLDEFLARYAGQNHRLGLATTHVLVDDAQPSKILGYASVAMAEVRLESLRTDDQKRLPRYPLPALRLARLAIDTTAQRQGHGEALLGFVIDRARTLRATDVGVCLVVVDALHERASAFYENYGFRQTADDALTLYLPLGR
jgi:ribosomal protein S18 acetylase RimI-like enzyme